MKTGLLLIWDLTPDVVTTITDARKLGSMPSTAAMVTFENTGMGNIRIQGKLIRPGQSWSIAEDPGGVINFRSIKLKFEAASSLEISTWTRKNYKYITVPVDEGREAD